MRLIEGGPEDDGGRTACAELSRRSGRRHDRVVIRSLDRSRARGALGFLEPAHQILYLLGERLRHVGFKDIAKLFADRPQNVAIGIDARGGKVQVSGWTEDSNIAALDLAHRLEKLGARLVIYTDIARDGVLEGPNIEATRQMIENTELSVIASGGVSSVADVRHLAGLNHSRLEGVIIGKALYEGRIKIEEAFDAG